MPNTGLPYWTNQLIHVVGVISFTDEETGIIRKYSNIMQPNATSPNSHQNLSDIKANPLKVSFLPGRHLSSLRSQLTTSMEASLIPPGKVIHQFNILYYTRYLQYLHILPGFPRRIRSRNSQILEEDRWYSRQNKWHQQECQTAVAEPPKGRGPWESADNVERKR